MIYHDVLLTFRVCGGPNVPDTHRGSHASLSCAQSQLRPAPAWRAHALVVIGRSWDMSSLPAAQIQEGRPRGVPVKRHRFQHKAAVVVFSALQGRGQLRGGEAAGRQAELDSEAP